MCLLGRVKPRPITSLAERISMKAFLSTVLTMILILAICVMLTTTITIFFGSPVYAPSPLRKVTPRPMSAIIPSAMSTALSEIIRIALRRLKPSITLFVICDVTYMQISVNIAPSMLKSAPAIATIKQLKPKITEPISIE